MRTSIILLSLCAAASAWAPHPKPSRTSFQSSQSQHENIFDPAQLSHVKSNRSTATSRPDAVFLASSLPIIFTPEVASAATSFTSNAVPSALAAYGHYISLLGILGCIMAERLTIKPNMTPEEEDFIAAADIGLGIWGVVIAYTGYLRTMEYEKGFDFYSHEPLFWLKIAFVGVFGAASFFNTTIIIKRAVAKRNGDFKPMGEKLSKRMIQICNAELVAIATIPLTATFMARGVGSSADIPWQAEAALAALVFGGLSFKYLNEAFNFEDNPIAVDSSSD
mmetsp:Transcript_20153/g.43779  ORF Transcript_20153/g.43779 Transcript_20153/m.43779 type:complete len:279 (+) Transcript_20153:114-950(+)|eukprot:CAMPEP_0172323606 /NCGR_PEP_ID=MMETSP1058-20130122/49186_1 /TAXON_ID=83371 /ORGANISM="Detonula confervacea, Strain CCMP 353" /LENGTH=278 /DNA_ID=CAMNT_0013039659 /DNA_START=14 /DNA_END=850 /DNA_ORIENTATION=+